MGCAASTAVSATPIVFRRNPRSGQAALSAPQIQELLAEAARLVDQDAVDSLIRATYGLERVTGNTRLRSLYRAPTYSLGVRTVTADTKRDVLLRAMSIQSGFSPTAEQFNSWERVSDIYVFVQYKCLSMNHQLVLLDNGQAFRP